jgi:hypothetical protein
VLTPAPRRIAALSLAGALALGVLSGCGGAASDSSQAPAAGTVTASAAAAQVSQPTAVGGVVRPSASTPRAFVKAVNADRAVVAAFLMKGAADDDAVRGFLKEARSAAVARHVAFFTYDLRQARRFGDLPELLDVHGTPTVVVIGRDHRVVNVFRGLTDGQLVRQAISTAKDAPAS